MPIIDPEEMLPDRWKHLTPEQQKNLIREIKYNWALWARENQTVDWEDDDWDILLVLAGRGFGKSQALDTALATWDKGFKTLGEVAVGDIIFDEAGQPTRVLATFDSTPDKAYRLHFSDGTYIDACDEHQWVTWTHRDRKAFGRMDRKNRTGDRPSAYPENWPQWRDSIPKDRWGNDRPLDVPVGPAVRTTQDIVDTITYGKRGDSNHSIPLAGPLNIPHDDSLSLDPYVLGLWLGDGSKSGGTVAIGAEDQEATRTILAACGVEVSSIHGSAPGGVVQTIYGIHGHLREIGVLNNKHVPHDYLWASEAQRLSLLQGLMDSDGFCHADSGHVEFCNMNRQLADSVVFLARSLGQKPVLTTGRATLNGVDHGEKYRVNWRPTIPVFRLPRKLARIRPAGNQSMRNQHRMIVGCEEIDPVPMRCLTVDSPNSMYLIGEALIPTHNTRMGAEAVREFCKANPGARVAITAPTYGSARDVCFEGDSGLLEVSSPEEIDKAAGGKYNRSLGQLKYTNGSLCQWYSGGDPERFRGPQHHLIWADELCAWEKAQDTWDMMLMGLRLGAHPRIIITTTPKPSPLIIELVKRANEGDKRVKIVTGSTFDNSANLPSSALDALRARYEGTTLGRQELYAELILDSPGALWSREAIEINRVRMYEYDDDGTELSTGEVPDMNRIVVAVDPAMSARGDRVAETGIVVAGVGTDGHGYVLEDATMENASPDQWANKAIEMYHKWQADKIVYEKNQGGDLIRHTFQTIDDRLPLKWVVASKGKALRAEPVSALYEQGRVHHVGSFPALEDQMAFWDPNEGNNRTNSPDRVDALVWAFTELMLHGGGGEVSVPWATSDDSGGSGGAWGGYAIPRM